MTRSRILAGGLAALTAVAGSLTFASPASAEETWHLVYTTDSGTKGGYFSFSEPGDVVQVCDNEADGKRVDLYIIDSTTRTDQYGLIARGAGNCVTRDASDGGKYNLTEGHYYSFTIRLMDCGSVDCDESGINGGKWLNDH